MSWCQQSRWCKKCYVNEEVKRIRVGEIVLFILVLLECGRGVGDNNRDRVILVVMAQVASEMLLADILHVGDRC